jgi:hypothetical protein
VVAVIFVGGVTGGSNSGIGVVAVVVDATDERDGESMVEMSLPS